MMLYCKHSQVKTICTGGDCHECLTYKMDKSILCEICGAHRENYRAMMGEECTAGHGAEPVRVEE